MKPLTLTLALAALALAGPALAGDRTVTTETDSRTVRTVESRTGPAAPDREVHRDDATLHERVTNALELTFGEDALDVDVEVEDGVVYLGGYIPTEGHRRQVHDVVYAIAGVKGLELQELKAMTYFDERPQSPE